MSYGLYMKIEPAKQTPQETSVSISPLAYEDDTELVKVMEQTNLLFNIDRATHFDDHGLRQRVLVDDWLILELTRTSSQSHDWQLHTRDDSDRREVQVTPEDRIVSL